MGLLVDDIHAGREINSKKVGRHFQRQTKSFLALSAF